MNSNCQSFALLVDVRDERTHPHRPRLVVYHSTCRPLSSSPPREQLCNRSCSNKHTRISIGVEIQEHGHRSVEFLGTAPTNCSSEENRNLSRRSAQSVEKICLRIAICREDLNLLEMSRIRPEGSSGSLRCWLTYAEARSARLVKKAETALSSTTSEARKPRWWGSWRIVSSL